MNFIAIDFETANHEKHSACAVGLVVVRQNQIVQEYYSLIRPETSFSPTNIQVHGIEPKDVQSAPDFFNIWQIIQPYFQGWPLMVAHNIPFDLSVLKACLAYYQLNLPKVMTLDTVQTSRHFLKGKVANNRLNTLANYYQIPLRHHEALDDARACAKILIQQNKAFGDKAIRPFVKGIQEREAYFSSGN